MEAISRLLKESESDQQIISASDHWKHALWDPADIDATVIRVPICLIFFLFLWSIDLFVMDTIHLTYHQVLGMRQSSGSPLLFVLLTALFLSILFGFHMTTVCQFMGFNVEYGVLTFYGFVLLSLAPFFPGHESRMYFFRVLKQIVCPGHKISFPEIMIADALCSLSKVFKDIGITAVVLCSRIYGSHSIVDYHNQAMVLVAILSSIPFAIRIRQCNVQLACASDYHTKIPITLNILKYMTSFPPIWLAAIGSLGYVHDYLPSLTIIMATINSLYSYTWDIVMDWGLLTFYSNQRASAVKVHVYPPLSTFSFPVHLVIATVNLTLRFAWFANRLPAFATLSPSNLVLLLEAVEIFRRSMWFIFRIEWEMVSTELKKQNINS